MPSPEPPVSSHPMITRSKAGIFRPKLQVDLASLSTHCLHVALLSTAEPKGFKTAAKDPKWMATMHEEFESLQQDKT